MHKDIGILLLINLGFVFVFGISTLVLLPQFSFFVLFSLLLLLGSIFYIRNKFLREKRALEVEIGDIQEKANLLEEEIKKLTSLKNTLPEEIKGYKVLGDVQVLLSKYLEPHILCREFLKKVSEIFKQADNFLIYLVNFEKQTLELKFSKINVHIKEKKGDAVDKQVLYTNKPVLIEEIKKDFRFSYEELPTRFSSLIACPISVGDKIYGIIRLEAKETFKFGIADLRFLQTLTEMFSLVLETCFLYKRMKNLAIKDSLTGLYLRNYTLERLNEEIRRAGKFKRKISILLVDIDHFKKCNDLYGHLVGDIILRNVADIIKRVIGNAGNVICRLGGEEFLIILPNTDFSKAMMIAEELRKNIQEGGIKVRRKEIKITISIGISIYPDDGQDFFSLMQKADSALYKAKKLGRNRVCY